MTDKTTIAAQLAAWATAVQAEDISREVLETARRATVDTLAVALAGSRAPVVAKLLTACEADLGAEGATAIGCDRRARPETATLVNGTAAHALDFDDTCFAGIVHGSAAILPALLAAAEAEGADGRAVLTAFVIGSEVVYSLGAA